MLLLLAAVLLIHRNFAVASQTCYWPSGSVSDSGWVPCLPNGGDLGQCCLRGDACLTNGLCFTAGLAGLYRGACTDRTWTISSCPQYCHDIFPDGMAATTDCPVNGTQTLWNAEMNSWCGSNSNGICTNGQYGQLFKVALGNVSVIAGQSSTTATVSASTSGASATSMPSITTGASTNRMVPQAVLIGVGVGVALPFALLSVLLGTLFLRERKRRTAAQLVSTHDYPHHRSQIDTSREVFSSEVKGPVELPSSQSTLLSRR